MKPLSAPAHGKGGLGEGTCLEITVLSLALPLTCAGHWESHATPLPYLRVVSSNAEEKQPLCTAPCNFNCVGKPDAGALKM